MKCKEIAAVIEQLAPRSLAYDWDNVGLLFGDAEQEVTRLLLTLDMDIGVAQEAARVGAQMVVGHHPILFDPVSRVTAQTPDGRLLQTLARNSVSYYAAHTNLDIAKGGLNDLLAKKFRLKHVEMLEPGPRRQGRASAESAIWMRQSRSLRLPNGLKRRSESQTCAMPGTRTRSSAASRSTAAAALL